MISGAAGAHLSYAGTTMTNGNGAFLDRQTLRKDLSLTVTGHAQQSAASAGIGVVSGLGANNGAFSSYSNSGGVVTSRLDTTVGASIGWIDGLSNGSDSHRVGFFGFELTSSSKVNISAEALSGIGTALSDLIPSISVYKGIGPYQGHDGATIPIDYTGDGIPDPYNIDTNSDSHLDASNQPGATPLYSFAPGQTGVFFATQDMTLYNNQWERYNIVGLQADFLAGNNSVDRDGNGVINQTDVELMTPEIGILSYLGSTLNTSNHSVDWSGTLGAGFYTFAIGGSAVVPSEVNRGLRVNFSAAPVPVPAAMWLFGSALAGFQIISRRRGRG